MNYIEILFTFILGSGNSANQNQIHYNSLSQDDNYDKSDHSTWSQNQTTVIEEEKEEENCTDCADILNCRKRDCADIYFFMNHFENLRYFLLSIEFFDFLIWCKHRY